ncbi:MAG TPA: LLM class flavin-dependent oxidoreductase [Candidatus Limnocylindrales bacterium]|nr:LLM class flavin-dependent oxidoreductase [Candidatus Limnocylindrales bacterium]
MKVGLMLPQAPEDGAGRTWTEISDMARRAEDGGADSVWVADHFLYRPGDGSEVGYHEAWSLVAALAATTSRLEVGTLVTATSFRTPGMLAKIAATTNDVAGGRLVLGLGCGWHEPEYRAFGYPFDHRVGRFEESLAVLVPLLRGERVTFDGRWTRAEDAVLLPHVEAPPRILIAATRERMLRLTARYADQWQTAWFGLPDDRWRERHAAFVAACAAEGRDPAGVETTVGVDVGTAPGDGSPRSLPLDPSAIADGLAAWAAEGVGHIQLGLPESTPATYDVCLEAMGRFRG